MGYTTKKQMRNVGSNSKPKINYSIMVEVIEQYIAEMKSKITAIQSQCTEKEKECEELKEALENSRHCRIIADKENDELKQGIKNAIDVKDEYKDMYYNAAKIIEELKAEILELRDSKLKDVKEINSLEAENERLKGLIEMYQQENIR